MRTHSRYQSPRASSNVPLPKAKSVLKLQDTDIGKTLQNFTNTLLHSLHQHCKTSPNSSPFCTCWKVKQAWYPRNWQTGEKLPLKVPCKFGTDLTWFNTKIASEALGCSTVCANLQCNSMWATMHLLFALFQLIFHLGIINYIEPHSCTVWQR